MNRERLSQMVVMLRGLPPDGPLGFDLGVWNCGTAACAVGHACLDPVFIAQGLTWDSHYDDPRYGDESSWYAVETFFDLTGDEATYLFYSDEYPDSGLHTTAPQVADRIESFLNEAKETA